MSTYGEFGPCAVDLCNLFAYQMAAPRGEYRQMIFEHVSVCLKSGTQLVVGDVSFVDVEGERLLDWV